MVSLSHFIRTPKAAKPKNLCQESRMNSALCNASCLDPLNYPKKPTIKEHKGSTKGPFGGSWFKYA